MICNESAGGSVPEMTAGDDRFGGTFSMQLVRCFGRSIAGTLILSLPAVRYRTGRWLTSTSTSYCTQKRKNTGTVTALLFLGVAD